MILNLNKVIAIIKNSQNKINIKLFLLKVKNKIKIIFTSRMTMNLKKVKAQVKMKNSQNNFTL